MMIPVTASKPSIHLNPSLLSYTPYLPVIVADVVCVMKAEKETLMKSSFEIQMKVIFSINLLTTESSHSLRIDLYWIQPFPLAMG